MKKRLLLLLMLIAIAATASAEMTEHAHCFRDLSNDIAMEYVDRGDYHDVCDLQKQACLDCGKEDYVVEHWFMEGHEFYLADEFHHEDKHHFFYTCAMCGHETIRTLFCSGSPCRIYNGQWSCAIVEPDENGRYIKPVTVKAALESSLPPAAADVLPE